MTDDGIRIKGVFNPPSDPQKRTFVLLHGLGSTKEEWGILADLLNRDGYGTFAYDSRGHGESNLAAAGNKISYESFGPPRTNSPWNKMVTDLDAAVKYLERSKKINRGKIGLMGASLGANICLIYAADKVSIKPVVALSPGLEYMGLRTDSAIFSYQNRPLILAASPGDVYAFQSSSLLHQQVKKNVQAVFLRGNAGHGVQMFDGSFEQELLREINKYK